MHTHASGEPASASHTPRLHTRVRHDYGCRGSLRDELHFRRRRTDELRVDAPGLADGRTRAVGRAGLGDHSCLIALRCRLIAPPRGVSLVDNPSYLERPRVARERVRVRIPLREKRMGSRGSSLPQDAISLQRDRQLPGSECDGGALHHPRGVVRRWAGRRYIRRVHQAASPNFSHREPRHRQISSRRRGRLSRSPAAATYHPACARV